MMAFAVASVGTFTACVALTGAISLSDFIGVGGLRQDVWLTPQKVPSWPPLARGPRPAIASAVAQALSGGVDKADEHLRRHEDPP